MQRVLLIFLMAGLVVSLGLLGPTAVFAAQTEDATYVGSDRCLMCHSAGILDKSGWKETLHANIYREPSAETVIGDFNSPPVEFKVGDAVLTVSFDDGGGNGPWTIRLQGAGFDETYTVARVHGGKAIEENEDPVLSDAPGRRVYIGKQRYHTKIGNSYYILPAQWNPFPDRDGKNQGWVPYHPSDWMDENGNLALAHKASEERRCAGCHQSTSGPTVNADGEYVLEHADDPSFWNIGCERCHGPGSEHAVSPSKSNITNPDDLTAQQQNELCGACHIRPTGHPIPNGDASPGYPYSDVLQRTYRPGDVLADFIAKDSGGYWPNGTSKKHHQQYADYQKSKHFEAGLTCISCHVTHNETNAEHDLKVTARDNSLCTQCHASLSSQADLAIHTRHPVDLDKGIGRCVDCHMPAVQKSGVNYDIHAHTFEPISPQVTLDTQDKGGQPNSCAVSCHGDGLLGAPTFGIADASLSTWNEATDVAMAERLLNFYQWIGQIGPLADRSQTLEVAQVSAAPKVDGVADDPAWARAPVAQLSAGVKMQAVTDGKDLYVLAKWPDETMSMTRSGSWTWDGSAWSTTPSAGQSEDRLAIMWNINASGFADQGCGVKCHGDLNEPGTEDDAFLDIPGERADMWHMKAARSLGAISASQSVALTVDPNTHEVTAGSVTLNGYADDKYIGPYSAANAPDGGRYGDAGGSTYGRNRNSGKTGPLYIEKDPADYIDAMTLRQDEIDAGEVLVVAEASASEISSAWDKYEALGAVVPERILRPASGSRGNVRQSATWSDGMWVSEYSRALVTDADDDVQFDDLTKTYLFGVAVMDNFGGEVHNVENRLHKLVFQAGAPPVVVQPSEKQRAVVNATVTQDGAPAAGLEIAFARSIAGRPPVYRWKGITGADGQVEIEIVADSPQYWRMGASGYYVARAADADGAVVAKWRSIPLTGGKETVLALPIGERAQVVSKEALAFALLPNAPNPFNPSTTISYQIPEAGEVWLGVYNTLGQVVRVLVQDRQDPGQYRVTWDGKDALGREVSSGIYIYRLVSQTQVASRRMLLLK